MRAETLKIERSADWDAKIRRDPTLNVVVDPMVYRTADVFLRGAEGWKKYQSDLGIPPEDQAKKCDAISKNIGSLCTFFDVLILEERLPMYDYYYTFPPDIDMGAETPGRQHWLVNKCNSLEEGVLVEVAVYPEARQTMMEDAKSQLRQQPPIQQQDAANILSELSAFDYEWRPDLWPSNPPNREERPEEKEKRTLEAFLYGGLLFSGYAERTGAEHILQPKRSRLYLAASLRLQPADQLRALFAELRKIARETPEGVLRTGELPEAPTFLPYLLSRFNPQTPDELLQRAVELRYDWRVEEYKTWRRKALNIIEEGRALDRTLQEEIRDIVAQVNAKMRASIGFIGPLPTGRVEGEVGGEKTLENLGWHLKNNEAHKYRKLLMDMVITQQEFANLDWRLKNIWEPP